uniref:UspA domain-containing protein n=1 Tax=Aegilops tauschii subsp. strangulata TaxID=200361 RepID=A0A453AQ41_AEGTS
TVVLVAVDDSDHSYRALEWAVRHVAATAGAPGARAVELVVVHAKPSPSPVVTMGGPGAFVVNLLFNASSFRPPESERALL